MHELKQEFEVLLARLDCVLLLIESGSPAAAEPLIPALKLQAEKTSKVLDETIEDYRLYDLVSDKEAEAEFTQRPIQVTVGVTPAAGVVGAECKEEDEDEDEDEEFEEFEEFEEEPREERDP